MHLVEFRYQDHTFNYYASTDKDEAQETQLKALFDRYAQSLGIRPGMFWDPVLRENDLNLKILKFPGVAELLCALSFLSPSRVDTWEVVAGNISLNPRIFEHCLFFKRECDARAFAVEFHGAAGYDWTIVHHDQVLTKASVLKRPSSIPPLAA